MWDRLPVENSERNLTILTFLIWYTLYVYIYLPLVRLKFNILTAKYFSFSIQEVRFPILEGLMRKAKQMWATTIHFKTIFLLNSKLDKSWGTLNETLLKKVK